MRGEILSAIQDAMAAVSASSLSNVEVAAILGHLFAAKELATRADYGA